MNKKHNTAMTSILSWKQIKKEGKNITQRDHVLSVIDQIGEITSRKLTQLTGLERASVTRCVNDLLEMNQIVLSKTDKCPVTGRLVSFYSTPKPVAKYADQKPVPVASGSDNEAAQFSLFAPNGFTEKEKQAFKTNTGW